MSVKPTLLKEIRKDAVQRHKESTGHGSYNRFELLSPRGRTFSTGKRQLDQGDSTNGSGNASKNPKLDSNAIFAQLEGQEGVISELETLLADMDKVGKDLPQDPRIDNLCKIVKLLAKSHKNITSICVDASKAGNAPAPRAVITVRRPSVTTIRPPPPIISEEEVMTKKVKQALRDAEKKTIVFNTNFGTAPIMNKETLSRKFTVSLAEAVKSGKHDYHIGDAEEVLDDILSCSKLEFLGSGTKLFYNARNDNDVRNNKMYTVPVRMDFRDRETRFEAEIMLKKICKVNCSVPYPKRMRTLLNDLVQKGKSLQPDCFIRTRVNVENLTVEVHAKTASGWLDLNLKQSIPLNILGGNIDSVTTTGTASAIAISQEAVAMDTGSASQVS